MSSIKLSQSCTVTSNWVKYSLMRLIFLVLRVITATAPEWITRDICANLSGPITRSLRTYGGDGDVFTFEAGRMCSSGEGLYAFNTKKAPQLFKLVACNLQPPSDLSPVLLEASPDLKSGPVPRSFPGVCHRCVSASLVVASNTDLKYINSRTFEQLEWPLKYLRKYGSNGKVFSFVAMRKCPGGEGLYTFNTSKASQLCELVAHNINHGNLQGVVRLPPSLTSPPLLLLLWGRPPLCL